MQVTLKHHEPVTGGKFDLVAIIRFSCMMADTLGFEVIRPLQPRKYEELLAELPELHRKQISSDPAELSFRIATKINSIESV